MNSEKILAKKSFLLGAIQPIAPGAGAKSLFQVQEPPGAGCSGRGRLI